MSVPPFHGNISFNAQHSPMGAFFSFTCGHFGSRGGFGLQIGKPGNQNLYIGVKNGEPKSEEKLICLPFFEGADSDEAARYDVERKPGAPTSGIVAYRREQLKRHYGWASDRWVTPEFEFTIYTAFGAIAEHGGPIPAIHATLQIDNTAGRTTKTGVFAIQSPDRGVHLFDGLGFSIRDRMGVMGQVWKPAGGGWALADEGWNIQRWTVDQGLMEPNPRHGLGGCPGIVFTVPPGEKRELRLAIGVYLPGLETTRLEGRYAYTRNFASLHDVLSKALKQYDAAIEQANQLDAKLVGSGLSADQQFLIAHATRSYYGSTQLLDVGGQPFWVVNEGEYCMMNTLDLSVDQVFWELEHNPWVVRNLLDNFVRHYSYVDQHGLSFCHDMGFHNQFTPFGHSSYELPHLNAVCFSYMTAEQLCNWILIAACYMAKTKDVDWARRSAHVLKACLESLINRTGDDGMIAHDSSRCGEDGAEITTYDSLDHSLAQTRNNVYMGVKAWASFIGLNVIFTILENKELADLCRDRAVRAADAMSAIAGADGVFPAVNEKDSSGYHSRILPAVEGLMYLLYWHETGVDNCLVRASLNPESSDDAGKLLARFRDALKRHTQMLLKDPERRNVFEDGGIKLSSTSNNSWMSKIAIFQHVCRKVFNLDEDPEIRDLFAKADAAHVKWMTEGESAYWACSDQFVSGVARGSKYYPRIITTALWMG